jgi:hypothetical protein
LFATTTHSFSGSAITVTGAGVGAGVCTGVGAGVGGKIADAGDVIPESVEGADSGAGSFTTGAGFGAATIGRTTGAVATVLAETGGYTAAGVLTTV